jgi:hypothetical protein
METHTGYVINKVGTEFLLKTKHGEVKFQQPCGIPSMGYGDMVIVILNDKGGILAISNVSNVNEMNYRNAEPYRSELISPLQYFITNLFVLGLPILGYFVARLGYNWNGVIALWLIGWGVIGLFLYHARNVSNHNVRVFGRVQKDIANAFSNPEIWSIPEPEHSEGENWKD